MRQPVSALSGAPRRKEPTVGQEAVSSRRRKRGSVRSRWLVAEAWQTEEIVLSKRGRRSDDETTV